MHLWWFRAKLTLHYIAVSVIFMLGLILLSNYRVSAELLILFAALLGFEMAVYRIWRSRKPRKVRLFLVQLLVQLAVLQALISAAIFLLDAVLDFSKFEGLETFQSENWLSSRHLILYGRTQLFAMGLIFLFEIQDILGKNFFWHYVTGKYRRPTKEMRILLFMDLADSTAIAESLGTERFYAFLNDCYQLLTMPIIEFKGELLKYVGDEVILFWTTDSAKDCKAAFGLSRKFNELLAVRQAYFLSTYGHKAVFRSAVHSGEVMVAYIGELKKQLDFSGDAMNATSRMCGMAKGLHADILISQTVFDKLRPQPAAPKFHRGINLAGRSEAIDLVGINF